MGKMIPRLYVFDPTDHVLIEDYLNPKVRGEELPYVGTVFEMERHYIYGGKQPWDIFYMIAQGRTCNAVYLFTTPPPNEYNTSTQLQIMTNIKGLIRTFMAYFLSHILRVSANNNNNNNNNNDGGTWKVQGNGAYVPVEDPDNGNQVIGFKKIFIYEENDDYSDSNQDDVQWVMTEYITLQPPKMQSLDRLVCKIEKIQKIEEFSEVTNVWAEDDEEFDDEST